jgi:glycosyltransferase involved in cell wall biosynthesis
MKDKPLVSVVVPTFNSEWFLERCLRSVREQTYPCIEVIVVDKNSKDKTVAIAKGFGVKVFVIEAEERCTQMNYGVKKAKGEFVYIVGSDFVLEQAVVEEAVEKCVIEGYDAVCVHNTSDPSVSFWAKVRKLERDCYAGDELNVAARFLKKSVFESIGGFDESLIAAEDYDLHNRLLRVGYKIGRIRAQEVHIGEPRSLLEVAEKHYYYGKTIGKYIRKSPEKARKQLSPIRLSYLRHLKDFLKHPVLTVGFIFYQLVRYTASFSGFIVASSCETVRCKTKGKE